jgi:branched-chain amino acid transport system permease protein
VSALPLATVLGADWQTLADALGLGGIYALMAVGIGLVFGVLRLVNFAYGQLVMAGAYSLAFAYEHGWPVWTGVLLCFGVVLLLSLALDRVVFRPLRAHSPAVMLVATFAVAFLLQSVALLWFGPLGKVAASFASLNQPVTISGVDIRKISIVTTAVALAFLLALVLLLARTSVGLHMRAAALDFRTARLLGVRANRVIGSAVLISGLLAATVAVMMTVQTPLVTPDFALRDTILVLAGVVLGGMNRLVSATLGGFAIGFASGFLGGALPTDQSQYLPSFLFAAVILVLLFRPGGLFTRTGQRAVERV